MTYKISRAIIMAAGKGERLYPLTQTTPKPLVKVEGVPMIENIIESLREKEIVDIVIVLGHLKEQFYYLAEKYPGVTFLENKYYDTCNNISSLYVARDYLKDVMILDGDQIIENTEILNPLFQRSSYCAFWQEEITKEWLLEVKDDLVVSCQRDGGRGGWQLHSVSLWREKDAKQLKEDVERIFMKEKMTDLYWDDIALFVSPENYQLGIRKMQPGDVVEIDSLEELVQRDESYRPLLKGENHG